MAITKTVKIRFEGKDDGAAKSSKDIGDKMRDLAAGIDIAGAAFKALGFVKDALSGIVSAIGSVSQSAMELETAMIGVKRTTGLAAPELDALKAAFMDLGRELPIASDELAAIAQVAGQLGIASGAENPTDEIRKFTEIVARAAVAMPEFAGGAEEVATSLAKLKNIFGMTVEDTGALADVMNHLSNTTAATAPQINQFMTSFTAAPQIGITAQESAALGAVLVSLGKDAGASATQVQSAFTMMFKDTNIEAAAQMLGMTKQAFVSLADADALGALTMVTEYLGGIESGTERMTLATEIFGQVGAKSMLSIIGQEEELYNQIGAANEAYENRIAVAEEVAVQNESTAAALEFLNVAWDNFGKVLGEYVNPILKDAYIILADVFNNIRDQIEAVPNWYEEWKKTEAFETVIQLLDEVSYWLGTVIDLILGGEWGQAWQEFESLVEHAWDTMLPVIQKAIDAAKPVVSAFLDWLVAEFAAAVARALASLAQLGMSEFGPEAWGEWMVGGETADKFRDWGSDFFGDEGSSAGDSYQTDLPGGGEEWTYSGEEYGDYGDYDYGSESAGGGRGDAIASFAANGGSQQSYGGNAPTFNIHYSSFIPDEAQARRAMAALGPSLASAIQTGRL